MPRRGQQGTTRHCCAVKWPLPLGPVLCEVAAASGAAGAHTSLALAGGPARKGVAASAVAWPRRPPWQPDVLPELAEGASDCQVDWASGQCTLRLPSQGVSLGSAG